jgi:hypothetical protein
VYVPVYTYILLHRLTHKFQMITLSDISKLKDLQRKRSVDKIFYSCILYYYMLYLFVKRLSIKRVFLRSKTNLKEGINNTFIASKKRA